MKIVVLGAGLMGRLLTLELARAGHTVTVYDAGDPQALNSAARAAAAMLAPLAESVITEAPVVAMGLYALDRWPQLLARLTQPVFFQRQGTVVVWHPQDRGPARQFAGHIAQTGRRHPALPQPQVLDASGLAALEPGLSGSFDQGLHLPGEGQLDNRQWLAATLHEMQGLGIALHWDSPRSPDDFIPGQVGHADWVLDCRGLGAQAQCPGLRGVRGEIVTLHAPQVSLSRPTRLIHPRYPIYIAPKEDGCFLVGATEIESDDRSPMSVRSALELLSAAYTVNKGFAEARIVELVAQCRPALPDNLPAIRRLGPRCLQINGLYRHGYLISPALLDITMQLIQNGVSPLAEQLGVAVSPSIQACELA